MTPLSTTEARAHLLIVDLCDRMHRCEIPDSWGISLMEPELRRFRARCPVATCRRVLTTSPWLDGMRVTWCRCGHRWRECSIELKPAAPACL